MHVTEAAWRAAGQPNPFPGPRASGTCARCEQPETELVPTRTVVSKTFIGYDNWSNPRARGLCPACAWAYSDDDLRKFPHLVHAQPALLKRLTGQDLAGILAAPLPADTAVIVPLHPGRKHLMPTAQWGRITIDDAHLRWTAAEAGRFAILRRLRFRGFGSRMLTEPTPPFDVLRRQDPADWPQLLIDWDHLQPWRAARPWLALAIRASLTSEKAAS